MLSLLALLRTKVQILTLPPRLIDLDGNEEKVRAFLRGPFYQAMTSGLDTENTVLLAYRRRIGMHVEAPKRVREGGVGEGGRGGGKGRREREREYTTERPISHASDEAGERERASERASERDP